MIYRIKQIDENTFIPQCKHWLNFNWRNIDKTGGYVWYTTYEWSQCESFDLANTIIEKYKSYLKYPKYYKV